MLSIRLRSSRPSLPSGARRPRARAAATALALAGVALTGAWLGAPATPRACAGEPDAGAPAAVPQTPRLSALEQEIRHLERNLQALRRARAELTAGRPEPVPVDAAARAAGDARRTSLREVARYEAARAKALGAYADAVSAKDDAKVSEARTALDAADTAFVAAVQKIDAKADAKAEPVPAKPDGKADAAPAPARSPAGGDGRSPGRRGSRHGAGDGSSMGSGDDLDDADDADDDEG